jgi:predicted DNA-binding protein
MMSHVYRVRLSRRTAERLSDFAVSVQQPFSAVIRDAVEYLLDHRHLYAAHLANRECQQRQELADFLAALEQEP